MMKAVNALLIGLDRLRNRSNILVICTSNLMEAMVVDCNFVLSSSNCNARTQLS